MKIHSLMAKDSDILDAALLLFEERSYGMTPVPLVAERAGVAAGTIYRYFPGKAGLVNALYRRWKGALGEALRAGLDAEGEPEQVFRGVWDRLGAFVVAQPGAFAFLETHHHAGYLDAESRALGQRLDDEMAALVARWQAAGAVRAGEPALLVAQVYGGLVGVVRHFRERGERVPPDLAARTVDAAWRSLAP